MAQTKENFTGYRFAGALYGRAFGSDDGWQRLGNVSELSTSTEVDKEELLSTAPADYGSAISVYTKKSATNITIVFNSFDRAAFARSLMGQDSDIATTAASFNKTVPAAVGVVELGVENIDAESLTIQADGAALGENDIAYTLSAASGFLEITSLNTTATELEISGTNLAGGWTVAANSITSFDFEFKMETENLVSGKRGVLKIPHAVIAAEGGSNWIADDWVEKSFTGSIVKVEGLPEFSYTEFGA